MTLKELLVSGWYRLLYRKFDGDDLLLLYRRGEDLQGDDLHTWPEFIFCRFDVHTHKTVHQRIDFSYSEET